jgi:hypothetical protein
MYVSNPHLFLLYAKCGYNAIIYVNYLFHFDVDCSVICDVATQNNQKMPKCVSNTHLFPLCAPVAYKCITNGTLVL